MKQKFTIIIIDDSKIIIDRLTSLLTDLPVTGKILCGFTYNEGGRLLGENRADVVILDVNLPGKSGIDLLRMMSQKKYPCKAIIMMTENPSEEKKQLCKSLGAHYFLNKFNDFETIAEILGGLSN